MAGGWIQCHVQLLYCSCLSYVDNQADGLSSEISLDVQGSMPSQGIKLGYPVVIVFI